MKKIKKKKKEKEILDEEVLTNLDRFVLHNDNHRDIAWFFNAMNVNLVYL